MNKCRTLDCLKLNGIHEFFAYIIQDKQWIKGPVTLGWNVAKIINKHFIKFYSVHGPQYAIGL